MSPIHPTFPRSTHITDSGAIVFGTKRTRSLRLAMSVHRGKAELGKKTPRLPCLTPSRTSRAGNGQALCMSLADIDSQSLSIRRAVSRSVHPERAPKRRPTATPNKNAINSEPRGASRVILLKMLNGIPGFRPASIASLTRWTVPFTASETSAMVDFGSGTTGSKPS
jgi:hypothetical protein